MLDTRPLLLKTDFPAIERARLTTLQVNLGYRCNLSCTHCHVNAGPTRTEMMNRTNIDCLIQVLAARQIQTLDLTGGAPEMNPYFCELVEKASALGVDIIDRCNLTILQEPEFQDMAEFLVKNKVTIVASLPCHSSENVEKQRGKGVFEKSIKVLQQLNLLGYSKPEGPQLHLVYNPSGPFLPPPQQTLENDYRTNLKANYGIEFNNLFTLTNMPISRFGAVLLSTGQYSDYMQLLKNSYDEENLSAVMCRSQLSVDWQGNLYDCDFNQMLKIPAEGRELKHLRDLLDKHHWPRRIAVGEHCYGCTAGQGSSCNGALDG